MGRGRGRGRGTKGTAKAAVAVKGPDGVKGWGAACGPFCACGDTKSWCGLGSAGGTAVHGSLPYQGRPAGVSSGSQEEGQGQKGGGNDGDTGSGGGGGRSGRDGERPAACCPILCMRR